MYKDQEKESSDTRSRYALSWNSDLFSHSSYDRCFSISFGTLSASKADVQQASKVPCQDGEGGEREAEREGGEGLGVDSCIVKLGSVRLGSPPYPTLLAVIVGLIFVGFRSFYSLLVGTSFLPL